MKKRFVFGLLVALIALGMAGCPPDSPLETPPDISPTSILPPADIRGEALRDDTIEVSWSAVSEASSYNVYAGTSAESLEKKTNTAELKYTMIGLSPATRYYIAVSSVNADGEGNKGTVIPVTTRTDNIIYNKEFLGEWLRMDTGEKWYISSTALKIDGVESSKRVSLHKDSERVVKVTEGEQVYYLFGFRIPNAKFSGRIVSFGSRSNAQMSRAAGSGLGGITTIISNLEKTVTQSKPTDANGRYVADDIIPGDDYTVTPEGGTPTIVTPQFDGDDVGTITVTQGVNFKTRIVPHSWQDDIALLHADKQYQLDLEVENTGNADWTAGTYTLDFGNAITSSPSDGIIGTIEPGKTKSIPIDIRYSPIPTKAYEICHIGITINEPITNKTWEDSVSLKIYKGAVNLNIQANTPIAGIIIGPNARVWNFKRTSFTASVPISDEDYWVIFSGATADTEAVYSLGISVDAPDTTGFTDTARYEPNNTEGTATVVIKKQITAYLHKNDIDYYRVNLSGLGKITINSPSPLTDENISGFPTAPVTISKSGTPSTYPIAIAEEYASYKWYIDNVLWGNAASFTMKAAHYSVGNHTLTLVVDKNGVPYSKEQSFTVTN
jgi:hypothetical protein